MEGYRDLVRLNDRDHHKCPFYGMHGVNATLIDSQGNQCGLIRESFSPCYMEMEGSEVNFAHCELNTELTRRFISDYGDKMIVLPKEIPEGVSLIRWISIIMPR